MARISRSYGSDPALLWLLHRPAAAAPNRPLAWGLPYAATEALKGKKKKKKKNSYITSGLSIHLDNRVEPQVMLEKEGSHRSSHCGAMV